MKKALGFYRPFGFKKNVYMVFKTSDRFNHQMAIRNQYNNNEFQVVMEMLGMMELNFSPCVKYSKVEYKNHDKKFTELLEKLEKDGNLVERCDKKGIKKWPYVTLSTENYIDVTYLDRILDNKS